MTPMELIEKFAPEFAGNQKDEKQLLVDDGVMMTPGLVIDEQLKSAGAIPGDVQILQWLREV